MTSTLGFDLDGPAGAPVLVLGPSLGTAAAMWEPQVATFARHFRVLRYDHRGHGRSTVPDGDYDLEAMGGDVLALLDSAEVAAERVCYAGVSLGGMVGMWLAINAPERIERLVLVCTSAHLPPAESWQERAATVRAQGMAAVADTVLGRWFTGPYAAAHPDIIASYRELLLGTSPDGYAGCCAAIAGMDLRADLERIGAPTLVISGTADTSIPPEHGYLIASSVPGAQFALVDAAHIASVEKADEVTDLLVTHFAGVTA